MGLVLACFALFGLALNPRARADFIALAVALSILTGLHTFVMTVAEAYPINHFLEMCVLCLLTLVLAQSKGGWWADLGAVLTFIVASLTLESGLLVWVVALAARVLGMRGISTRGLVAMTLLLSAYFYLRFAYLDIGVPSLSERSSGFGTARLDPEELVRRFGDWPYGFYAYNALSSFLTVLLSEPREGVWEIIADRATGRMAPGSVINVVSSTITLALIVWFAIRRASAWTRGAFAPADRVVIMMFLVLAANAVISYGYTKDEIMSPAGVFYALGAFVALRHAIDWLTETGRNRRAIAIVWCVLLVAAAGWSIRSVGLHYRMHRTALDVRSEWVDVLAWLETQGDPPRSEAERQIVDRLRDDAIEFDVVHPDWLSARINRLLR